MLKDNFGRKFPYLRLSVTEACNFRCTYCLPNGYKKTSGQSFLLAAEIARLAKAFAALGTKKIRLTGGEPTTRTDLPKIAETIRKNPSIETLALTTNGYNLAKNAKTYFDSGINALNVSVDSFDRQNFADITGHDKLQTVLDGIEAAKQAGFKKIKINTVLLRGVTDKQLPDYLRFIKHENISIRFIELMQTIDNHEFFDRHHISAQVVVDELLANGFAPIPRDATAGPAQEFGCFGYSGKIGVIAPYSKDFCKNCNRLRVTSKGKLMLCLFGEGGHDLR